MLKSLLNLRLGFFVFLLLVLTLGTGCDTQNTDFKNTNYNFIPQLSPQGDEYLILEKESLVIANLGGREAQKIPASNPLLAHWIGNQSLLWLTKNQDNLYLLWTGNLSNGQAEIAYMSTQSISAVAGSSNNLWLAFAENDSLFLLDRRNHGVKKVSEEVTEFHFSPNGQGLIYSTPAQSFYLVLADTLYQTTTIELTSPGTSPLAGLNFLDDGTVVGFLNSASVEPADEDQSERTTVELVFIDLHAINLDNRQEWAKVPKETPSSLWQILVAPDKNTLLIQELKTGEENGMITLYSLSDHQKTPVVKSSLKTDFVNNQTVLLDEFDNAKYFY
ncbi:MAG: hypothetical protein A2233_05255 [Candidatus Kerfeldbacteria bacterium RIFOXYA2_FULL_38_24]|uniref:Uncharacterized protein n=1 Tax=Candidatus Kerfeldbacteria bacterium RIFOXYB2_FULL_38_14 TaxID=1798547 RepID=A0A1G2BI58_9BACT|nr:MAG: hypothetical protein A2233_05255 [Candidatus Kerfeldbacteria bacterium RIFOXYA2_FULL_38_24]OGY88239.1 MAG: hypothetical protein A2319_03550 [Candidatus Kerfeldbacteria bacterium RIFOXYB2_FULL_38_14]